MLKKLSCCLLGIVLCACVLLCDITPVQASILMITQQPESAAALKGEIATVTVEVKGDGLQYEWWYAVADTHVFTKSDVIGDEYAVEMNESTDGLRVYCVVSDAFNHVAQTKTVMLNMITPLEITRQPQEAGALAGEAVLTSIEAVGDELTYAWWICSAGESEFHETAITTPVYEQIMDDMHAGARIYCVVTDKYGQSAQSAAVTLTCRAPLVITQQPQSVMVAKGDTAEVKAEATGDAVAYTWWVAANENAQFANSGVTTQRYAVTMNGDYDGNLLYCVVTDAYGNALQTETVKISMLPPLEITCQPQNAYAFMGETASVSVEVAGEEVTYAWWFANADEERFAQSSITGSVYAQEMTEARAGRKVYCIMTDKYGQTVQSDTVLLVMKTPLAIVRQPGHVSVTEGQEATVSLAVQGDELTYAWYVTDDSGNFVADGCTEAQYVSVMDANSSERQVYCVVTDAYGNTVQTETVLISLIPAGLSYEIREEAAVVINYTGIDKNLQLPAVIAGCPVTEIAENAFAGCAALMQVTLPDGITVIGEGAFSGCEALTVINLPAQIETIGSGAFADCGDLKCIVVPDSLSVLDEAWFSGLDKEQVQLGSENAANAELWARELGFVVKKLHGSQVVYIEMPETMEAVRGEQKAVSCTIYCMNGEAVQEKMTWTTSAADIATVDETGLVTFVGAGMATITATAENGVTAACVINSACGTHEEVVDEAVAAEAGYDGLAEGKHCAVCGEVLIAQQVIPSVGVAGADGDGIMSENSKE